MMVAAPTSRARCNRWCRIRVTDFAGTSFSASAADERVLDVQFTDDPISVNLRDGRVIPVPLVWYPRLLEATPFATQELENRRRRLRNPLSRHRRGSEHRRIAARRARA
jgi:hypothetical protein